MVLFERSAVSLFERGKRAAAGRRKRDKRERVRERESKRDDDDDDVKFHSAGPRERHSFFPRKKNTQHTNEKRKVQEK